MSQATAQILYHAFIGTRGERVANARSSRFLLTLGLTYYARFGLYQPLMMNWIYTGRMSTKLKTFILRGSSWEVHILYENQGISSIPQNLLALSCIMFPLCSVGIVYFYHYSYLFLRNRTNTLPGSIICEVFKICDRVTCKKSFVKHRFITLKQYLFVIWIHKNSIIALAHSRHI